jgi:hypothetical protein
VCNRTLIYYCLAVNFIARHLLPPTRGGGLRPTPANLPTHAISIDTIISHIHPQPCYYSAVILSIMPKIPRRLPEAA